MSEFLERVIGRFIGSDEERQLNVEEDEEFRSRNDISTPQSFSELFDSNAHSYTPPSIVDTTTLSVSGMSSPSFTTYTFPLSTHTIPASSVSYGRSGTAGWSGTYGPGTGGTTYINEHRAVEYVGDYGNMNGTLSYNWVTTIAEYLTIEDAKELMLLILKCIEKGIPPKILADVSEQLEKDKNGKNIILQLKEYLKEREGSVDDLEKDIEDVLKDDKPKEVTKITANITYPGSSISNTPLSVNGGLFYDRQGISWINTTS